MKNRELIVPIYLKGSKWCTEVSGKDVVAFASSCENHGADALIIFDLSDGDAEHDQSISVIKEISRATDFPIYGGGNIRRLEDVKKLIYAGCRKVFLNYTKDSNVELTAEASSRFGRERILACVKTADELLAAAGHSDQLGGIVMFDSILAERVLSSGHFAEDKTAASELLLSGLFDDAQALYCVMDALNPSMNAEMLSDNGYNGVFCREFTDPDYDFMETKHALRSQGIAVNLYEASLAWDEIRTGSDGLLPVVVQDYRTLEVLMVAYMNEEAYNLTVRSGRMTYFSRSRQEIWVKGLTSGHYQYVRELSIDCDNDTLLAKVVQIGAACHTGNRSCFYRPVLQKEYNTANPMKVFEDVFSVIEDRKVHPKEGSYTNYLFDKGIDKILKKVGEEATEIVIAAKNPDPEEVVYEISDFLYHLMVLMSERGLTWEDITEELAKR
ncbi:MAG: bifunctional phosphoribosyl-AMP cyclohydrolase/phosphoribosyl-ATP diphosphatase HisIE [Clostridiales bacterium]|nr:bifunctional phosphoribosyl-AMP cyclohydrolase/phosphoribosyl-ATP diphosphatase HisIE [Clostridiales bacterium]